MEDREVPGEVYVATAALFFSLGNLGVKLTCLSLPTMEISALIASGGIVLVLLTVLHSGQDLLAKDSKVAKLAATRACLVGTNQTALIRYLPYLPFICPCKSVLCKSAMRPCVSLPAWYRGPVSPFAIILASSCAG